MDDVVIQPVHGPQDTAAESYGALGDSIKDGLQICRRGTDDPEDLTGRCLLAQRLAEIRIAFLQFLEQSHVLDGNYGLVGKGLEKRDLLVCKWANFSTTNHNGPNRNILSKQRRSKNSPSTSASLEFLRLWKLSIKLGRHIMNVNGLPVDDGSAPYVTSRWSPCLTNIVGRRHRPISGYAPKDITIKANDLSVCRVTQPGRILRHDVQHWLEIRWRTGNDT